MNTGEHILFLLKTHGPRTAQQLAETMQLTSMGVRRHLDAWLAGGLLETQDRADKVGRPARYWILTSAGHARFPDRHSELTVQLLVQVRNLFGEEGLDRLIAARESQSEAAYKARINNTDTLEQRLGHLTQARDDEGYMAELTQQADGSYLLVENHCPICAAATECQGFCRSELDVFRRVVDTYASVERVEHAVSGARRCVYHIKPIG